MMEMPSWAKSTTKAELARMLIEAQSAAFKAEQQRDELLTALKRLRDAYSGHPDGLPDGCPLYLVVERQDQVDREVWSLIRKLEADE